MAAITAAILAGASLAATTAGHFEKKKAARQSKREQEHANRVTSVSAQVQNATQRRKAIAQARIAQAQNQANAGGAVQSSSALAGSNSALAAQLGSNVGTQGQLLGSQQSAFDWRQRSQDTLAEGQQRAGDWNAVSGLLSFGSTAVAGAQSAPSKETSGPISNQYTGAKFKSWAGDN